MQAINEERLNEWRLLIEEREKNNEEQYNQIFPAGHQKHFEKQTSFDFSEIIKAITNACQDDVKKALDLVQPNETALWKALEKFRKAFTEHSKKEMVWNPQHFLEASKQYDANYPKFGGACDSPQNMLFWRQIVGYTQRFLPANVAMDVAQGLYRRVDEKEKPLRSLNFQYGGGASGLGYEYVVCGAGMSMSGRCHYTVVLLFQDLMSSKNNKLGKFTQRQQSHASCLIV